uniref:Uncharacterized protein n=1 Tax=Panagrolaimus sp. ES5 TaxID=591445 RepID=A0AC34FJ18_9BILA
MQLSLFEGEDGGDELLLLIVSWGASATVRLSFMLSSIGGKDGSDSGDCSDFVAEGIDEDDVEDEVEVLGVEESFAEEAVVDGEVSVEIVVAGASAGGGGASANLSIFPFPPFA